MCNLLNHLTFLCLNFVISVEIHTGKMNFSYEGNPSLLSLGLQFCSFWNQMDCSLYLRIFLCILTVLNFYSTFPVGVIITHYMYAIQSLPGKDALGSKWCIVLAKIMAMGGKRDQDQHMIDKLGMPSWATPGTRTWDKPIPPKDDEAWKEIPNDMVRQG